MFSSTTLKDVIRLERLNDELHCQKKAFQPRSYSATGPSSPRTALTSPSSTALITPRNAVSPTPKKLSWEELKRKRSMGPCFSCDEHYTPGHNCKKSQLLLMEGEDEREEEEEFPDTHKTVEPEISLQSLTGWGSPKTLRIQVEINRRGLVALIDSGASHNFIGEKEANRLGLKRTPTKPFNVLVADGHPLRCHGAYRKVAMRLAGEIFVVDFYGLPLSGLDVVLGVSWLERLGPIVCDWKAQSMKFQWAEKQIEVNGLRRGPISKVMSREIEKEARQGQSIFALTIQPPEKRESTGGQISKKIRQVLDDFETVFQTPTTLPPRRDIENHITLKESTYPVNVWPYRYAHFQKEEIEKHVLAMLDAGLVRPSSMKKCEFGSRELEYLGHIIFGQGVKVDQQKIRGMTEWPAPTTITELRGFLGLTGYYRKFILNYEVIAPLTNLLKKGKFEWSEVEEMVFNELKTAMTTTPTLALPNFAVPFVIQTDASREGIGAILTQESGPIAFMSRSLGVAKHNWSTYAREILAIVVAMRTWRPYLAAHTHTEQQKWMGKLVGYDYEITYKPGTANAAADALSRQANSLILHSICSQQAVLWEELRKIQDSNPYLVRIGKLAAASPGRPYEKRNGLVCFRNRVVIPLGSSFVRSLLEEYHDSLIGGHSGALHTFKRLAQQFYWPVMHRSIREYVVACDVCQQAKADGLALAGLLQPLPVPNQVWEDLSMDFIDGLLTSDKHTSIMVVVDRLSKASHLIPLSHPYTSKSVAAKFVENVVKLHGLPKTIGSSSIHELDEQLLERGELLSDLKRHLQAASNRM
ncbi:unnamed protein product [Arabidopsis halleri]